MTKKSIAKFFALASGIAVMIPAVSFAGMESSGKEAKPLTEVVKESCISGDLGVNVVSEYISRGIVFENQGVIAQPYADIYFKLYSGDGFINKVSINLGVWSSIQSHSQAIDHSTSKNWYEFDYTPGISLTFAKNFTATLSYFEFISPSDSFQTARSVNFNLAYDDSDLLGKIALHPHVTVLREIDGAAGLKEDGWYFEAGIAPSYAPIEGLTFTLPITAGFGDKNFYAGDNFGYVSAGINAAVPLKFIASCYGAWTFTAGYTYYHLGDDVEEATTADGRRLAGDENRHVFQGGIAVTF